MSRPQSPKAVPSALAGPDGVGRPAALHRLAAGGGIPSRPGSSGSRRAAAGQLPDAVRGQMDAAFVGDFSAVRVHVGPPAQRIDTIGSGI
jgi:hypothetical protein